MMAVGDGTGRRRCRLLAVCMKLVVGRHDWVAFVVLQCDVCSLTIWRNMPECSLLLTTGCSALGENSMSSLVKWRWRFGESR